VAKDEGENLNSDELKAQTDLPEAAEDLPDLSAFDDASQGNEDFGLASESEQQEAVDQSDMEGSEAEGMGSAEDDAQDNTETADASGNEDAILALERARKTKQIEMLCLIGVPVVILAVAALCAFSISTPFSAFSAAVYLIALGAIFFGVWKGRETNTFYSVILACALAALLTAVFILWSEVGDYGFHLKADPSAVGAPR